MGAHAVGVECDQADAGRAMFTGAQASEFGSRRGLADPGRANQRIDATLFKQRAGCALAPP